MILEKLLPHVVSYQQHPLVYVRGDLIKPSWTRKKEITEQLRTGLIQNRANVKGITISFSEVTTNKHSRDLLTHTSDNP